jgi:hypothetical protein
VHSRRFASFRNAIMISLLEFLFCYLTEGKRVWAQVQHDVSISEIIAFLASLKFCFPLSEINLTSLQSLSMSFVVHRVSMNLL